MLSIPDIDWNGESVFVADQDGTRYINSWNLPADDNGRAIHSFYVGGTKSSDKVRLMATVVDGVVQSISVHSCNFRGPGVFTLPDYTRAPTFRPL